VLYAMGEIVVFLLIAAIVGGLIGSVLCRARARRELEQRVDHSHRTHAAELGQIRARLDDRNVEIVNLNDQLAEAQGRLRSVEAELAAGLEPDAQRDELIEQLRTELEDAAARAVAAENARDAAQRELADVRHEVAAIDTGAEDNRAALAERDQTIRELEIELADLRVALSRPPVDIPPGQLTIDVPAEPTPVESARARVADIATRTRGDHERADDDLTRIRGIGPKINGMLKEMGITSFRQIAGFSPEDVHIVSEALEAFPDRIERDDWMSSARMLHEAKYGESLD